MALAYVSVILFHIYASMYQMIIILLNSPERIALMIILKNLKNKGIK